MTDITHDDAAIRALLQGAKRIAMVGASADPSRDSNRVFAYLLAHGYDVLPVTPKPDPVHGVRPVPDLEAAVRHWGGPIDIVDVFRAPDHTPAVAADAVASGAKAFWLQLDTAHPDAVRTAVAGGLAVVADRCIKIEHGRLFG